MKLKVVMLLLIGSTFNAQQGPQQPVITSQKIRYQLVTDYSNNVRNTQYFEIGNGNEPLLMEHFETIQRPVRQERKTIKNILFRNFIASDAGVWGSALLSVSLIYLSGLGSPDDRMHRFNQTTMCPTPDYYNVKNIAAILDQGLCGLAGAGAALCCMQCLKAVKECCNSDAEHQD